MSKQIAVRLPDDIVEFIDELVSAGKGRSRADVVSRAMARERRRRRSEHDAEILARLKEAGESDDDLDGLAAYASRTPLDID